MAAAESPVLLAAAVRPAGPLEARGWDAFTQAARAGTRRLDGPVKIGAPLRLLGGSRRRPAKGLVEQGAIMGRRAVRADHLARHHRHPAYS